MNKIRPLWRVVVGVIMLLFYVPSSSTYFMGQGTFYGWAFFTALFLTWIILSIFTPYDDPVRGIYEHMVETEAAKPAEPSDDVAARLEDLERRLTAVEAAVKSPATGSDALEVLNKLADILKDK